MISSASGIKKIEIMQNTDHGIPEDPRENLTLKGGGSSPGKISENRPQNLPENVTAENRDTKTEDPPESITGENPDSKTEVLHESMTGENPENRL